MRAYSFDKYFLGTIYVTDSALGIQERKEHCFFPQGAYRVTEKTTPSSNYRSNNTNLLNLLKAATTQIFEFLKCDELKYSYKARRNHSETITYLLSPEKNREKQLSDFCLDVLANHLRNYLAMIKTENNVSQPGKKPKWFCCPH